jgi:hypothetical protein
MHDRPINAGLQAIRHLAEDIKESFRKGPGLICLIPVERVDADQVYAVSAYVLALNGIVPDDTVLDATNLPKFVMPNRNGFISPDPRPDVPIEIGH